ncbi:amino acid ABC transporter permease [Cryobacterium sp. Y50]|uniref:amino acid ABC transporter permease n=1 Tax=Cryobacterium sp. Y50 TaxID=2048286 RepID=UPI000CE39A8B|nr:amino acid ABC transporter permease [Cryobacterium sp. Y50]
MTQSVLFDALGPRGRRKVRVFSVAVAVAFVAAATVIAIPLDSAGFFDFARWAQALDWRIFTGSYLPGLLNTLLAAVGGVVLAIVISVIVTAGRLSHHRTIRFIAIVYTEFFRAMPVLLLIWIPFLLSLHAKLETSGLPFVVVGLGLYNGAALAEILRAGIVALPSGQTDAATALGLSRLQVLRLVIFPQVVRAMLPAILAQMVIVLKDTSLGFIVTYPELLRQGSTVGAYLSDALLQVYIVIAGIYFIIAYGLTLSIRLLGRRLSAQRHASISVAGDPVLT